MPPIRTFKSAPINPHSVANPPTSSETQEQPQQRDQDAVSGEKNDGPAWAPATPTAASIADSGYPAARPGAPAMPAPTSSTSGNTIYTPTRTYPTSTASTDPTSTPPAPQPGSRPVPPSSSSSSPSRGGGNTVPPPPKVGEPLQPASYYAPSPQVSTQHQTIPNSTSTPYLSTYQPPSTSTAGAYGSTYVAGSAAPGLPLSQPEQSNSSTTTASSIFDATLGEGTTGQDILNTAKSWMASAGTKLAEAEEEVWRMVNKKS